MPAVSLLVQALPTLCCYLFRLPARWLNWRQKYSVLASKGKQVANPDGLFSNAVDLRVVVRGDVNGNGKVTIADALATALAVAGVSQPVPPISMTDMTLNGATNIGDAMMLGLIAGRLNSDWVVPAITFVSPIPVARGTTITIAGRGFGPAIADNQILFTTATGVTRVVPSAASLTSITVRVPDDAVSGPIQVYRVDIPLGGEEFPIIVSGTGIPLAITRISPYYQVQPGSTITLNGLGFDAVASNNLVFFTSTTGTVAASVAAASSTSLDVTVPSGAACGPIMVSTGGRTSNARMVTLRGMNCSVRLTGILGGGSPGDMVVLEGAGFDVANPGNNSVRFTTSGGGIIDAAVVAVGGTQLHVRIPSAATAGSVTATVGGIVSDAIEYRPPSTSP
jgi:hypothetical protein